METKNSDVNNGQMQQGDVILRRLENLPPGEATLLARGRCTLAKGEATGHHHTIEDDGAELVQIGERMLLKLEKAADLVHQEHGPITLEPGIWEVGQVQEFDYFAMMARRVAD